MEIKEMVAKYGMNLTKGILPAPIAAIMDTIRKEILKSAVTTIKSVHPYEKPVINVIPVLAIDDI